MTKKQHQNTHSEDSKNDDEELTPLARQMADKLAPLFEIKNSLKLKGPEVKVTNQGYGYDEPATREELVSRIETCFEIILGKDKQVGILAIIVIIQAVVSLTLWFL